MFGRLVCTLQSVSFSYYYDNLLRHPVLKYGGDHGIYNSESRRFGWSAISPTFYGAIMEIFDSWS